MAKTKTRFGYGRSKERNVVESFRNKDASVGVLKGGKDKADLLVKFPSGKEWAVEVKAARSDTATRTSSRYSKRFIEGRATPIVARVSSSGIVYKYARSGRALKLRKSRKRK